MLSRSLWIQTDNKLNDTTARAAFILSKILCLTSMSLICVKMAVMNIVTSVELVDTWCLRRRVSQSRATAIVAAAVAGLQAGSFLSSCISTCVLDSISRSYLTPKGTRPSLLCDNFLEFLCHKKWHLAHSTHNLISHEIEQSNGDIEEQRFCKKQTKRL